MRRLTVVGSKKMVVFDDMETDRKVTIYDKSVSLPRSTDSYGEYVNVRFGDISIPHIANDEPLRLECQEFVDAIREEREPRCGGQEGLAVVEVLDAMQTSLEGGGRVVQLTA
jgi:predicted dehydrogenase